MNKEIVSIKEKEEIRNMYTKAHQGQGEYYVDHILPLQGEEQGDKTIFADLLPDEETRKKQERDKNSH